MANEVRRYKLRTAFITSKHMCLNNPIHQGGRMISAPKDLNGQLQSYARAFYLLKYKNYLHELETATCRIYIIKNYHKATLGRFSFLIYITIYTN